MTLSVTPLSEGVSGIVAYAKNTFPMKYDKYIIIICQNISHHIVYLEYHCNNSLASETFLFHCLSDLAPGGL
jgi:hypothetical protein